MRGSISPPYFIDKQVGWCMFCLLCMSQASKAGRSEYPACTISHIWYIFNQSSKGSKAPCRGPHQIWQESGSSASIHSSLAHSAENVLSLRRANLSLHLSEVPDIQSACTTDKVELWKSSHSSLRFNYASEHFLSCVGNRIWNYSSPIVTLAYCDDNFIIY